MEYLMLENLHDLQYWLMLNHKSHKLIYVIGLLMLFAYIIRTITENFRIPSVVGYIVLGTVCSISVVKQLPFLSKEFVAWYDYLLNTFNFITVLAVSFISFSIGTSLSFKVLRRLELEFTAIVLLELIGAFVLVSGAMLAIGQPLFVAILLGTIATATAPAATVMVLRDFSLQGELSATLMVVLALDEALALIIFTFMEPFALTTATPGEKIGFISIFILPLFKILSAIIIGIIIGYISQRMMANCASESRKVLLILATIFGSSALAVFLHISPLITNISVGFAYRNFAVKRLEISEKIDILTVPLFAAFFILAGTKIQISNLLNLKFLIIAVIYTAARITGKLGGSYLGAKVSSAPPEVQKYLGFGLLPQIGVAIDLAFIIQRDFIHLPGEASQVSMLILNIILFTSFITEIIGPLTTEYGLIKAGEIKKVKAI
ncbi:cation:proton antiporter [Halanaerobium sp. MA284_MarDTE_T2]|uniref:cation:proton antiporter n=1 Tax=Halanaerobium sp. MA284_MarDTE_T2 TaxID=2183913 RepID=UPI000E11FF42|nr:cation:proton antiporter [Halanaerobium sp. MA284_MarDTE_T2]RCW41157.1 Kef-type K+ transport system membrane component KefB [Halanaerobium sp. MA284_MarDTE_T2]